MTRAIAVVLGIGMCGCAAVVEAPRRPAIASYESADAAGAQTGEPLGFRVRVTVRNGDEARAAAVLDVAGWNAEDVTLDDVTFVVCAVRPATDPSIARMEILGRCHRSQ